MVRYEIRNKGWNKYCIYDNSIADYVKENNKILILSASEAKEWMWKHYIDKDGFIWT